MEQLRVRGSAVKICSVAWGRGGVWPGFSGVDGEGTTSIVTRNCTGVGFAATLISSSISSSTDSPLDSPARSFPGVAGLSTGTEGRGSRESQGSAESWGDDGEGKGINGLPRGTSNPWGSGAGTGESGGRGLVGEIGLARGSGGKGFRGEPIGLWAGSGESVKSGESKGIRGIWNLEFGTRNFERGIFRKGNPFDRHGGGLHRNRSLPGDGLNAKEMPQDRQNAAD